MSWHDRNQEGTVVPYLDLALSPLADPQEPPWVEVLVEILLALLAQPSHLIRQVARSVFSHVCSHLTPHALQLILNVSRSLGGNGYQNGAPQAPGCPGAATSLLILRVIHGVWGPHSNHCCASLFQGV